MSDQLVLGLAGALLLAAAAGIWIVIRRRRRSTVEAALAAIAFDRLGDVVIPDGIGGEIHIEHLLLTCRGILVIEVKPYEGAVFAGDRMDQWTVIGRKGRVTIRNPLRGLHDRVAAVRLLVRDMDVAGFVVFPPQADFSKGRPEEVRLPQDLLEDYARPAGGDRERLREAFAPHWEQVCAAVRVVGA